MTPQKQNKSNRLYQLISQTAQRQGSIFDSDTSAILAEKIPITSAAFLLTITTPDVLLSAGGSDPPLQVEVARAADLMVKCKGVGNFV